jgi:hypothetical protein
MLAPGDLLVVPSEEPTKPPVQPPAERPGAPFRPPTPTTTGDGDDPPSFLLILLRALGAIHT